MWKRRRMLLKQASDWLGWELPEPGHGERRPAAPGQSHAAGFLGGSSHSQGGGHVAWPSLEGSTPRGDQGGAGGRASTSLPTTWGSYLRLSLGSLVHVPLVPPAPHQPAPDPPRASVCPDDRCPPGLFWGNLVHGGSLLTSTGMAVPPTERGSRAQGLRQGWPGGWEVGGTHQPQGAGSALRPCTRQVRD